LKQILLLAPLLPAWEKGLGDEGEYYKDFVAVILV